MGMAGHYGQECCACGRLNLKSYTAPVLMLVVHGTRSAFSHALQYSEKEHTGVPHAFLYLWELFFTFSILGLGKRTARVLRFNDASWAFAGILGVSLLLLLGSGLSLLHLIRRDVFFAIVILGTALFVLELLVGRKGFERIQWSHLAIGWKLTLIAGAIVTTVLLMGSLRQFVWNNDDLQAYMAFARKALQCHSLQPDPFSERRISTAVGGQIFIDAFAYAAGDIRAMGFVDSVLGYALYILLLAEVLRAWAVPRRIMGVLLLLLTVFTLIKVNLTLVYLSVAAFLAILLLLTRAAEKLEQRLDWRTVLPLAILLGACFTTKSSNIAFAVPLIVVFSAVDWLLEKRSKVYLNGLAALVLAFVAVIPWSLVHHRTEGTFFFPTLGLGYHASAYGRLLAPGKIGSPAIAILIALPMLLLLAGALFFAARFAKNWRVASRASLLALLATAWIAVLGTAISVGGEAVDRYTAPFAMPALLLFFAALTHPRSGNFAKARRNGFLVFAFALIYEVGFIDWRLDWSRETSILAYEAFERTPPRYLESWEHVVSRAVFEQEQRRAFAAQATLPEHATALEAVSFAYPYDFRRNTLYFADFPGMAGLPDGMPIGEGAPVLRQYLLSHGIRYAMYDRRLDEPAAVWARFLASPKLRMGMEEALRHPKTSHMLQPWGRMQWYVAEETRKELLAAISSGHVTYDDGFLIVARLD